MFYVSMPQQAPIKTTILQLKKRVAHTPLVISKKVLSVKLFWSVTYYFFDLCATQYLFRKLVSLFSQDGKKYIWLTRFYMVLCYCAMFFRCLYTGLLFFFTILPTYIVKFKIHFLRNQRHFVVATPATLLSTQQYSYLFLKYVFLHLLVRSTTKAIYVVLGTFICTVLSCVRFFFRTYKHLTHCITIYKVKNVWARTTRKKEPLSFFSSRYFWLKRLRRRRMKYSHTFLKHSRLYPQVTLAKYYAAQISSKPGSVQQRIFRPLKLFVGARTY